MASIPKLDYWHWKSLWELPVMRYSTVLFCSVVHSTPGSRVRKIFMD